MRVRVWLTALLAYIFLVLSTLTLSENHNQKSDISFQHFNVEHGLSSAAIGSIYQDRTGYLWFITDKGLDKFDGYKFTNYKYPPKDKVNSRIFPKTIWEDHHGNIWIASYNGGIEKFDPQRETFINFLPAPDQPATEWRNTVISLYIDKNDIMWIGSGHGFYKFNISTGKFTSFKHNENDSFSLGHNSVNAIYEDKAGTLWLATGGGLEMFDRETNKFYHYWHYTNNQWYDPKTMKYWLLSLTEDEDGKLWLAADGGLVKFDKMAKKFTLYDNIPSSIYTQSTKSIKSICYNGSENIWLSTNYGLSTFNKKTRTFLNYIHSENDPGSLSSNDISDLFFDRAGSLWIGTNDGGLNKLDMPNPLFKKHLFNPLKKAGPTSDYVSDIYQDNKGNIWVSTNKGMKIYDPLNEATIPKYTFINRLIFHDKSGNILVAPRNNGLYKFDSEGNWTCYQDSNTALYPERICAFFHGSNNQYWLGNVQGDLYQLNPTTNKIEVITNIRSTIWTIYVDSKGLVWFGGYSTGLFCYDQNKKSLIQYNSIHENQSTLIDNTIWSFFEDKNSTLWFGCNSGLSRFNRSDNNFTRYYGDSLFIGNGVMQILEDKQGNLWMSTGNVIAKFNPLTGKYTNYYSSVYFPEMEFLSLVGYKTDNGEMYFGGNNGFVWFHPDSIKDESFIPPIVITKFLKFEKPFSFDKEIELAHSDNFISFEFAALSYINNAENQYAYKMEGLDIDWIYCGTRRYASYPNMEPGEYVFRVKGSTSNRIWNEAGASLRIIINPPWWATTWAYILYFLLILSIIYFAWKMQVKRIRVKQAFEMSRFEAEKLHEIDEIKNSFFANISHEFRTPLTLILGPAKQLLEGSKDEKTKSAADLIHRSAKKLNRLVDELLDISKIESGEMKLKACTENLVSLVKDITLSFSPLADRKKINFGLNCNENEIITYIDKNKFEKILNNVLSNAFKFTPEGGEVEVTITCQAELVSASPFNAKIPIPTKSGRNDADGFVEISIRDTGIGIPEDQLDKIFNRFYQVDGSHTRDQEGTGIGLSLSKELIELHKGKIEVESEEGKGTTFRLLFPLGRDHLRPEEICEEDNLIYKDKDEDKEKARTNAELEDFIEIKNENKIDIESAVKPALPTLLIVEDNADVRKYIRMILENQYSISEAKDGEEGLNKSFEQIPDLIISDIMMPKLDGFQLCSKLKTDSRTSHIPVILLTAKATISDKINGLEIGADDYIMKPFEASELKARIKNLIQQRKRLHEHFRQHGLFEIEEQNITSLDQKFIQKSIEVINNNLSNINLSVELLASNLAISKWVLNKKLSALTGDTPAGLIKRIRLSKAAKLIEHSTGNISEIALEVGFTNPAYFAECFKKQFGLSPSQYHNGSTIN